LNQWGRRGRWAAAFSCLFRSLHAGADGLKANHEIRGRLWTCVLCEAGQARIDAVKHVLRSNTRCSNDAVLQPVGARRRRAGQHQQLRCALALVHAAGFESELRVALAEQRIEFVRYSTKEIRRCRRGLRLKSFGTKHSFRLPGAKPFADLFRITRRIGGGPECLERETRRGLMVLSTAAA